MRKQIIYVLCQLMIMVSVGIGAEAEKLPPNEMRIKVKKLDGPQIIRGVEDIKFIDKEGKTIKKISLKEEEKITEKYYIKGYKKGQAKMHKFREKVTKGVYISENRQYAGVVENSKELSVFFDNEEASFQGEGDITGKFTLYDVNGKILFEKEYREGKIIGSGSMIIFNDGSSVVILSESILEGGNSIIIRYDKEGKEKILFPKEDKKIILPEILKASTSGRYIAIRTGSPWPESHKTVFFDLQTNKYWKADKDYGVYELNENGITKVSSGPGELLIIDLKNYMGE